MRRFTVLGFTEAELGFVLAALFAAMAVGAVGTSTDVERAEAARDSIAAAQQRIVAERDSVVAAFNVFRDSVVRADSAKRSTKTPRCTEKGEPPDAIADVRIRGADRYEVNGTQMSWAELSRRLAPQIERSASLACRYLVIARATNGVDAASHTDAVARLLRYFDVAHRTR